MRPHLGIALLAWPVVACPTAPEGGATGHAAPTLAFRGASLSAPVPEQVPAVSNASADGPAGEYPPSLHLKGAFVPLSSGLPPVPTAYRGSKRRPDPLE